MTGSGDNLGERASASVTNGEAALDASHGAPASFRFSRNPVSAWVV